MEKKRIQVIGGGFSGLTAAYFLVKEGFQVRLVEESKTFGGKLITHHGSHGLVESAANALLSNALVEETAAELGIELVNTLPSAKKRYIFRRGKPRRWPLGGPATMRFLGQTVPRFISNRKTFMPKPEESVKAWGYRSLGEEATESLLVPGLSGIYAGKAEELSASLILGRFLGLNRKKIPRGRLRGSVAPLDGMGEWGIAFSRWLKAHGAELSSSAEEGLPTVVALPPPAARVFLAGKAPRLEACLSKIEMLPILSVTCFFPESAPGFDGFGCLFPRSEGFRVLGILANDRIFPGRARKGYLSETWIFGGATDPEILKSSDDDILLTVQFERERIFDRKMPLAEARIHRWPAAIPNYNLALESVLRGLNPSEGDYTLFGTYLGDLGLARVLVNAQSLARSFK